MRQLIIIAIAAIALAGHGADSKSAAANERKQMERLDTRISKLNFEIRQNIPKLADYTNKVITLREQAGKAKSPDNVARLEKALEIMEERKNFYDALVQSQRGEVADLLTKRRLLSGAYQGETIAERNANLGVDDDSAVRAARKAREAQEEKERIASQQAELKRPTNLVEGGRRIKEER